MDLEPSVATFVSMNGCDGLVKLTVSGHPGSGTSTLVKALMERNDWTSLNGGDVFREEAKRRGMSLGDFGELCHNEPEVDRSLDELLKQRMKGTDGADIVESRLAGWWAYRLDLPCLRLWLDVDDEERARRVAHREGLTVEDALQANQQRAAVDGERFRVLYDLVPEDPEPYTHVIDATSLNASQILEHVVALLEALQ
ncbi:MAG: cytidylate kinase [Candidatus Poseidoniales archaeon]|nr:MAG: cytidylate kinase [Candidatus Poseidoniales archaeon]